MAVMAVMVNPNVSTSPPYNQSYLSVAYSVLSFESLARCHCFISVSIITSMKLYTVYYQNYSVNVYTIGPV